MVDLSEDSDFDGHPERPALFGHDKSLLGQELLTIRTMRRFTQDEIILSVFPGNIRKNPIEWDFGVISVREPSRAYRCALMRERKTFVSCTN
jgi:hypothetical protein